MRTILAVLAVAATSDAAAETAFEKQVAGCWNPPIQSDGMHFVADFDVTLDDDGNVLDIHVTGYQPRTDLGKEIVRSASSAIEQCAPYQTKGNVIFHMALKPQTPMDPF